jgi:DNA replication protein DnaC
MNLAETIDGIIEQGKLSIKANEGDYIGEDGLLYCGNCHTKKQTEVNIFGAVRRPMCLCKCMTEKRDAEEAAMKREEFERRTKEYRKTGFPESDMQNWTFENDDMANERITKAMRNYVDNFAELKKHGKGLLLYGSIGKGKTYAACEVANALIDKGYPVLVTNFARLTNTIQGKFEGKQEYIDSLNQFQLLVIDDLGAERKSEYMQEIVYNIIDSRYRAGLPFIITTNMTIEEIKTPTDIGNARIYDRIIERCFPIEVNGKNRRRKKVIAEYDEMKKLLGLDEKEE